MERNQIPISLKTVASSASTVFSFDNGDTISNPYDIAKIFNNYFDSIAETTINKNINYSNKHFSDFLVVVQYFCNLLIKKK